MDVEFDVSRETRDRLTVYVDLLKKWNSRINLVAKSTEDQIWERHIGDSLQIWPIAGSRIPTSTDGINWVDFGSGGGLPGAVLAILSLEVAPFLQFHLIESDQRKAAFLRTGFT